MPKIHAMDENVLVSVKLQWRKRLRAKKRKGEGKDATPAGESKGFLLHVSWGQDGKIYISLWVLFSPPLFMHLQLTWLCQCLLKLVITTSPHHSDTSDERNIELTQGAVADSWNWLQLLCHCELYRLGFATLKGENGRMLEESTVLCPSPPGRKGRLSMVLTQLSCRASCILTFLLSSLGRTLYIRYVSVRNKTWSFIWH